MWLKQIPLGASNMEGEGPSGKKNNYAVIMGSIPQKKSWKNEE